MPPAKRAIHKARAAPYSINSKEQADKNREELGSWTEATGISAMSCSRYSSAGVGDACKYGSRSIRCQRCISLRKSCDGGTVATSRELVLVSIRISVNLVFLVARLREEYTKYDKEEREAEVALSEALARLHRVRQLKQNAKERGDEVFHRGMEALDAYDGVAERGTEVTSSGGPSSFEQVDKNISTENLKNTKPRPTAYFI